VRKPQVARRPSCSALAEAISGIYSADEGVPPQERRAARGAAPRRDSALLGGLVIGSISNGMDLLALPSSAKVMVTAASCSSQSTMTTPAPPCSGQV
jgi:hypothetical protein